MKKTIIFLATLTCFISVASVNAQTKEVTSKDVRLVKGQPHVYISFEREGKREPLEEGESKKGVWLRFHNNSKWQVGVCMFDVSKEYGDLGFNYEVERFENISSPDELPTGYEAVGGCSRGLIKPGSSLLFSVPREHLANGLAIKLQFRYQWESDPDGFPNNLEPKHYVYFYSSDIPQK